MPWHGMDMHLPSLTLDPATMHHLATSLPHTLLIILDTLLDRFVHQTRQTRRAQTRPDVHAHARARPASIADAPGHVVARTAPLTSAPSLCTTCFTTSPATAQTRPLARGNAVDDARFADVRRDTGSSRHAHELVLPSFSPQSRLA
jgi:hypothetical protein